MLLGGRTLIMTNDSPLIETNRLVSRPLSPPSLSISLTISRSIYHYSLPASLPMLVPVLYTYKSITVLLA